jgi:hypothetical protein
MTLRLRLPLALLAFWGVASAQLQEWAAPPGYALAVDSRGFVIPTAIAFVPSPGDAPDAPLYYVAELQGAIKVVTNDRSVRTFATVPTFQGQTLELLGVSQQGLAGLCLAPEQGYVFATFTYHDAGGVLRNNLVRFGTTPERFGLAPTDVQEYPDIFSAFQASPAHQIGNCVVVGEQVFVGVGDGGNAAATRDPDVLLGKVLCLTLDALPCRDGPGPRAYVQAQGFRNPFGLAHVGGQLFAVDNGVDIDRFVRVEAGRDYLWDGSDQSVAAAADLVLLPAISPVQLGYVPPDAPFVDEGLAGRFVFAVFGPPGRANAGLVSVAYDFEARRVSGPPGYALEHVGTGSQHVTGFAVGPDGLYAAPNLPGPDGQGYILKLAYQPDAAHAVTLAPRSNLTRPTVLGALAEYPCTSCHSVAGYGGGVGPTLDRFAINWRLTERLNTAAYEEQVAAVDALQTEPFTSFRAARREVLAARGRERTAVWLKYFLQEPRFDNPDTQMPNLGLSEADALAVRGELYRIFNLEAAAPSPLDRGLAYVRRNALPLAAATGFGFLVAALLAGLLLGPKSRRKS